MPLYEYKCHHCGKKFDALQKFSDAELTVHDGCGGAVERLVSAPAFHFKGTGWYVTDYAKSNGVSTPASEGSKSESSSESKSENKQDSGKSDGAKSESKSETKSENKSESKPESKPAPATTASSSEK